jgi:predicted esterase
MSPWIDRALTRREALRLGGAAAAAAVVACRTAAHVDASPATGRLRARPAAPGTMKSAAAPDAAGAPLPAGRTTLGLASGRDGLLYVPRGFQRGTPVPLVLMLHGAGQSAQEGIEPLLPLADAAGLLLLVPDSRGRTWDFLYGPYGPDVAFIDAALEQAFRRAPVDPARLAIEGFSDGASYALSLGLTNGDLFARIVAFSPCILAPAEYTGHPGIFIAHGTEDQILPVARCGRPLAERLRARGYEAGRHGVPPDVARAAVAWMQA